MTTQQIDLEFIADVEARYFRTQTDIGANLNAIFIWNLVRQKAGLTKIDIDDLPAFCKKHKCYHVIKTDYGCVKAEL